ncbi:MAG TPA: hypothetical protein VHO49_15850 [Anaerolineales bacterium]|nr:hypothetical protein [Anaerolineales bacterium]
MRKKSKDDRKRLDPMIVVALIGLTGTIIAALLASPLLERWLTPAAADISPSSASSPASSSTQTTGNHIRLNQTVEGTLYFDEAGVWTFSDGPATVTITLDVSPFGSALIIVRDPSGVERAYVDQQSPQGVTRLVNFSIPTEGDYSILVRNTENEQVDYTLTVQDALTPVAP